MLGLPGDPRGRSLAALHAQEVALESAHFGDSILQRSQISERRRVDREPLPLRARWREEEYQATKFAHDAKAHLRIGA